MAASGHAMWYADISKMSSRGSASADVSKMSSRGSASADVSMAYADVSIDR